MDARGIIPGQDEWEWSEFTEKLRYCPVPVPLPDIGTGREKPDMKIPEIIRMGT
jgi:hypothetical protein